MRKNPPPPLTSQLKYGIISAVKTTKGERKDKMYIVVSCEHTNSFYEKPTLCERFDTLDAAKAYCEECVRESLRDFPAEKRVDGEYVVQTYDEAGNPDYGCVWSVLEV